MPPSPFVTRPSAAAGNGLRLQFAVFALVLLESLAFQAVMSLKDLLPQLAVAASVYRPDVFGVHQLLKSAVGAGLLWLLLFGRDFHLARAHYLARQPADFPAWPWLLHLLAFGLLLAVRGTLNGVGLLPVALADQPWAAALYALVFAGFVATALRLLAPGPFWRQYLLERRALLLAWCMATLLFAGLALAGLDPIHLERMVMPALFLVTAHGAAGVLNGLGYHAVVDPASSGLGIDGFGVEIGAPCLGYEGATLALLVLAGYVWWNRSRLRPTALLLVLSMPVVLYGINILRIAALMVIGASWSPDVAVHGFHSAAGWVNLLVVLGLAVLALERFALFSRRPTPLVPDLAAHKVQLLPQVVLIAVSMLTLLVSPGFEWAYPVRVVVVGLVLLQFWPRFQWQRPQWLLPAAVGTVVFGLWLMMVPVDPALSKRFAQTLWSVPSGWALAWIALRLLGASVIVPLAEELAFRGAAFHLLADALRQRQSPIPAPVRTGLVLLMSSLAFGALHGDWLAASLAGLAYGMLRLHSGRVSDAVVAHGVTNLLLGLYVIGTRSWSLW